MLEPEGYRLQLNQLNNKFGSKELLTITDVRNYLGGDKPMDYKTVVKRYKISKYGIPKTELARKLVTM